MIGGRWKDILKGIPRDVKRFLLKGLCIFIAWQLLYYLLLKPARVPDHFLDNITAIATAKVVSIFYPGAYAWLNGIKALIVINGKKALGISDPCNALEIYVLYIAFLFCYPAANKRRFQFVLIGIPAIFVMNVVRCCLLTWLNEEHRGWFDISHHYLFTTIMYLLVFYLWLLFSKKNSGSAA
jgi:exosortase family protein XrtF